MARKKGVKNADSGAAKTAKSLSSNPEEIFGMNAGKVWVALNENPNGLSSREIALLTGMTHESAWGGLGWLGREGKLRIDNGKFYLNQ